MEATASRVSLDRAPAVPGPLKSAPFALSANGRQPNDHHHYVGERCFASSAPVVAEAHDNWPGSDANEQACLLNMKTQLYAALMDHLLESDSI